MAWLSYSLQPVKAASVTAQHQRGVTAAVIAAANMYLGCQPANVSSVINNQCIIMWRQLLSMK